MTNEIDYGTDQSVDAVRALINGPLATVLARLQLAHVVKELDSSARSAANLKNTAGRIIASMVNIMELMQPIQPPPTLGGGRVSASIAVERKLRSKNTFSSPEHFDHEMRRVRLDATLGIQRIYHDARQVQLTLEHVLEVLGFPHDEIISEIVHAHKGLERYNA